MVSNPSNSDQTYDETCTHCGGKGFREIKIGEEKYDYKKCGPCTGTGSELSGQVQDMIDGLNSILEDIADTEGLMTGLIDDFSGNEEHIRIPKEKREEFEGRLIALREGMELVRDAIEKLEECL